MLILQGLLPVFGNTWRPWILLPVSIFALCILIRLHVILHLRAKFHLNRTVHGRVMFDVMAIFKKAAVSHVEFSPTSIVDDPRSAIVGCQFGLQISTWSDLQFRRYYLWCLFTRTWLFPPHKRRIKGLATCGVGTNHIFWFVGGRFAYPTSNFQRRAELVVLGVFTDELSHVKTSFEPKLFRRKSKIFVILEKKGSQYKISFSGPEKGTPLHETTPFDVLIFKIGATALGCIGSCQNPRNV